MAFKHIDRIWIQILVVIVLVLVIGKGKGDAQSFVTAPSSFSSMSVSDNALLSFEKANVYIENLEVGSGVEFIFRDGTPNELFLAGDTSNFGYSTWSLGNSSTVLNFLATPNSTTATNQVIINNPGQAVFNTVKILKPQYSTLSGIVLKETSKFQNLTVANQFEYPVDNFLYLGDIEVLNPSVEDTANKMTLTLSGFNHLINGNNYSRDYYIITPGRSRLGRYVATNQEQVFPVGDHSRSTGSGFAPVAINNKITSENAIFYVTASKFLYDWDSISFRSAEDLANLVVRRQNNVRKHWIIKSSNTSKPSLDVIVKLQHAEKNDIEEENYMVERTIISRYIGAKGENAVLNRNTISVNDISTPSYSYWENILGRNAIQKESGNRRNVVPGRSDDVTHIGYITDFRNDYPIYMKAGFSEDSMPMGAKMVVPCWTKIAGTRVENDQVLIEAKPLGCEHLIQGYSIYYTTDKNVAKQGFPAGSSYAVNNKLSNILVGGVSGNSVTIGGFDDPKFKSTDTMYIQLVPIPVSGIPLDNMTVQYVTSPQAIVLPDIAFNDDITILNNPISTVSDDVLQALLSKKISDQIASGECYLIEPTSKVTLHKKALEKVGSVFGYQMALSSNPIAPGVYTILIRAKLRDGSQKEYISKVIVQ